MRTALTLARPHGEENLGTISGPEVPLQVQRDAVKALSGSRVHPEYSEVQYWESDGGRMKLLRFQAPVPAPETEPEKSPKKGKKSAE